MLYSTIHALLVQPGIMGLIFKGDHSRRGPNSLGQTIRNLLRNVLIPLSSNNQHFLSSQLRIIRLIELTLDPHIIQQILGPHHVINQILKIRLAFGSNVLEQALQIFTVFFLKSIY